MEAKKYAVLAILDIVAVTIGDPMVQIQVTQAAKELREQPADATNQMFVSAYRQGRVLARRFQDHLCQPIS